MSDESRDTPVEEVRNSQLLRAEYGIPSAKDAAWTDRSRAVDQTIDDLSARRAVVRFIDPVALARTEELIARARFFTRVRAATDTGGALVSTTVGRVVPFAFRCAVVMLVGASLVALLVLARNERQREPERY